VAILTDAASRVSRRGVAGYEVAEIADVDSGEGKCVEMARRRSMVALVDRG
jgi:hypothetical protein